MEGAAGWRLRQRGIESLLWGPAPGVGLEEEIRLEHLIAVECSVISGCEGGGERWHHVPLIHLHAPAAPVLAGGEFHE